MFDQPLGWLIVGFAGQALFSARFLVQWVYSERRKRSIIPIAFWYFSLAGGATLFAYALHIGDPVFILGQSLGVLIYTRNLYFIHKERNQLVQAE
ncbi:MAG: lipid-A-disaccharide synthase N-terminal domain-containing protein [Thiogranum sp.]